MIKNSFIRVSIFGLLLGIISVLLVISSFKSRYTFYDYLEAGNITAYDLHELLVNETIVEPISLPEGITRDNCSTMHLIEILNDNNAKSFELKYRSDLSEYEITFSEENPVKLNSKWGIGCIYE